MKIEFFHDVICSFCYPMSYRMRKIATLFPNIEIVHRSFALTPTPSAHDVMFGSRENAKREILQHWDHANENDDLHRFNVEGMRAADFPFPYSMPGLDACKAAYRMGGNALYWDMFDELQRTFFTNNQNVEDEEVLKAAAQRVGIDVTEWEKLYHDAATHEAVLADLTLARQYGVNSVPTLILDGKYILSGAQPLSTIVGAVEQVLAESKPQPTQEDHAGATCKIVDGKMQCD
jgi:predicted DsbA family dithiol-disulfide isomerase